MKRLMFCALGILLLPEIAWAQSVIVPDETLGAEQSRVTTIPGISVEAIEGGAQRGQNLFHSFREFNVDGGRGVYFNITNANIRNVLTRVTGNNRSGIFGTIGTIVPAVGAARVPNVNLFLINPNGIIFGENASLDLGASFFATTASGVQLGNSVFSATQPEQPTDVLTVNPSAFLFGGTELGRIEVQSRARQTISGNRALGLQVPNGETLLLLGGDVIVNGGELVAARGRIEVGAVAGSGLVNLAEDGRLQVPDKIQRADVSLRNLAGLWVPSREDGDVGITARNIEFSGRSSVTSGILPGFGAEGSQAGDVHLDATGEVKIEQGSFIANDVNQNAIGNGGNIVIEADSLIVNEGSELRTTISGKGDAGSIQITAREKVIFQTGDAFSRVIPDGEGKGGNVVITAPVLKVLNGARLGATNFGKGNAGNVQITASNRVLFQGISEDGEFASTGFSSVASDKASKGGNVIVDTPILEVLGGAALGASTFSESDAGNVQITASNRVLFQGTSEDGTFPSAGFSTVASGGSGKGGNLIITSPILEVFDGAQLSTRTRDKGDAGNIQITASEQILFQNGSASSSVESGGEGNGGTVKITAPVLRLLDGSRLISGTNGTGNAGNIQLIASKQILFQNGFAFSGVESGGGGKGGNVVITVPILEVLDGSQLISGTRGLGDAGNVQIISTNRVLFQGTNTNGQAASAALSNVESNGEGKGGNVEITAPVLEVLNGAQLGTGTRGIGDAGNIQIVARNRILFQGTSGVLSSVELGGVGKGGNVEIKTPILKMLDGAQLGTGTRGIGDAGNVQITASDQVLFDGFSPITGRSSGILANNGTPNTFAIGTGRGGNVSLNTPQLSLQNGAVIDARTANGQRGGDITLNLGQLSFLDGGQILSISDGPGPAGSIQINATDDIRIAGNDPTHANRRNQFGNNVAPITPNSGIYVRSANTGSSGNILIGNQGNTPRLILDGGEINADSAALTGGNVNLTLNDALIMRNGSAVLSNAGGDGGEITVNSPFVISFPNENSDIIANAVEGTGGKITINADAILNFQQVGEPDVETLRSNNTNDISASSQFGNSGTLNLAGLNVDPAQGTTQLPTNLLTPADQISRRCAAERTATTNQSEFFITGRSGLPLRPGDAPASSYNTGTITATSDASTLVDVPTISTSAPITEAASWQQDAQGNIQLIASSQPLEMESNSHCDRPLQDDRNS